MNRVAIVRHGDYGSDRRLNEKGRTQMQRLGERLQETCEADETALILSSTAARALQSAEIIAKIMNAPVERERKLWSDDNHPENFSAAYRLVQSVRKRANLLVLVTHQEYAELLPGHLSRKDLGLEIPYLTVNKGQGAVIDYRSGTWDYLRG